MLSWKSSTKQSMPDNPARLQLENFLFLCHQSSGIYGSSFTSDSAKTMTKQPKKSLELVKWKRCTSFSSMQVTLITAVIRKHVLSVDNTAASWQQPGVRDQETANGRIHLVQPHTNPGSSQAQHPLLSHQNHPKGSGNFQSWDRLPDPKEGRDSWAQHPKNELHLGSSSGHLIFIWQHFLEATSFLSSKYPQKLHFLKS